MKIGLATFLVPFLFFYSPVLLGRGEWQEVLQALVTASIGVYFLACATEGWINGPLVWPLRAILIGAALALMIPEIYSDIGGLVAGVAVYAYQRWRHGRDPADKIPSPKVSDVA